jgi:CAAX protease family protein
MDASPARQVSVSEGAYPPAGGLPPPGWYQDPARPNGGYRWWDGRAWTQQVVPFPAPIAPPGPDARGGSSPPGPSDSSAGPDARGGSWPAGPPDSSAGPDRAPDPVAGGSPWPASPSGVPVSATPSGQRVIPARAVWYAVLGLVVGELVGSLLGGIAVAFGSKTNSAAVTGLGEIGLWSGMFGSVLYVSRRFGTRSLARDFSLRIRVADIGPGVLVAVVGIAFSAIAAAAFSGTRFAGTNTQIITGQRHNSAGIAVVTVIVALGAPFFEELFFRGLIRVALASRLGATGAIIGQGLLFGLAHYQPSNGLGNVSVIVTIGALGIILGIAAQRTGRLGAGMIGHGLFNLVSAIVILTG